MYLLDTNAVSDLRKAGTRSENPGLVAWATGVSNLDLFLSSISVLELEIGVQRVERRDAKQGRVLRRWLSEAVLPAFVDQILSFDLAAALLCAEYHVPNPSSDRDSFIAAIAASHELTVVTRNQRDFAPFGVALINPWT